MKTLMMVMLGTLFFFNKTVAQSRDLSFLVGRWEAVQSRNAGGGIEVVDTSKIYLFFGEERKPLLSFEADFSKSPAWFDFTVKDTAGNIRLQSLLQFINDDLIKWQLFDDARAERFTTTRGEILFLRRTQ